jgi:hypothetical protein
LWEVEVEFPEAVEPDSLELGALDSLLLIEPELFELLDVPAFSEGALEV